MDKDKYPENILYPTNGQEIIANREKQLAFIDQHVQLLDNTTPFAQSLFESYNTFTQRVNRHEFQITPENQIHTTVYQIFQTNNKRYYILWNERFSLWREDTDGLSCLKLHWTTHDLMTLDGLKTYPISYHFQKSIIQYFTDYENTIQTIYRVSVDDNKYHTRGGLFDLPKLHTHSDTDWMIKQYCRFNRDVYVSMINYLYKDTYITFQDIMDYKEKQKFKKLLKNGLSNYKLYLNGLLRYKLPDTIPKTETEKLAEKIVKDTIQNYQDEE